MKLLFIFIILNYFLFAQSNEIPQSAEETQNIQDEFMPNFHIDIGIFYGLENKNNYAKTFIASGFEKIAFNHFRYGADLIGTFGIFNQSFFKESHDTNALLYQAFLGFESDYFSFSAGREALELDFYADFLQGARGAIKIPQIDSSLNFYYANAQGINELDELSNFKNVGNLYIIELENHINHFKNKLHFSHTPQFLSAGLKLNYNYDFLNLILKYYFFNKAKNNSHFVGFEGSVEYEKLDFYAGLMKVFGENFGWSDYGDGNPLELGKFLYTQNAMSAYLATYYMPKDYLKFGLLYGLSHSLNKYYNEINIEASFLLENLNISAVFASDFKAQNVFKLAFIASF